MGDTQLWAEVANLSHIHFIPESMATHNILAESVTQSQDITKRLRFEVSNAELMVYLCDKYKINGSTRNRYMKQWCQSAMQLAFYTRNFNLAEHIKETANELSWKQWLQYYGARNHGVNALCNIMTQIVRVFRPEDDEWV
jgi:hypothetical protein